MTLLVQTISAQCMMEIWSDVRCKAGMNERESLHQSTFTVASISVQLQLYQITGDWCGSMTGGTTRCVEEVCLQCLARPMNMAPMFCLSGVIARRGASGDQCAVPETMSRSTLPYWPQSPDPELTPDPWWDTPELDLEENPSGEYLATLTKLKVSQIQIREILQSTTFLWSLEFWCV